MTPAKISYAIIEKILEANIQPFENQIFNYNLLRIRMHVGISVADANVLPLQYCTPWLLLKFITDFKTSCIYGEKIWCLRDELRQRFVPAPDEKKLTSGYHSYLLKIFHLRYIHCSQKNFLNKLKYINMSRRMRCSY